MKKRVTALIARVLTVVLLCMPAMAGETEEPGFFKRLFGSLSWKETQATVESPRDAISAVTRHIKYRPDIGDSLTSPDKTWEQGYGDCEDIAHAIVALCKDDGETAWVEVFYSSESFTAHAVAMGIENGQMWIADGRMTKVKDMEHARKLIASRMRWKSGSIDSKRWSEMNMSLNVAGKVK